MASHYHTVPHDWLLVAISLDFGYQKMEINLPLTFACNIACMRYVLLHSAAPWYHQTWIVQRLAERQGSAETLGGACRACL